MRTWMLLLATFAMAAALLGPSRARAHVIVHKTCLTITVEATSSPLQGVQLGLIRLTRDELLRIESRFAPHQAASASRDFSN